MKEYDDCVACDLRPSRFGRISEVYRFESVKVYALLRLSGRSAATHLPRWCCQRALICPILAISGGRSCCQQSLEDVSLSLLCLFSSLNTIHTLYITLLALFKLFNQIKFALKISKFEISSLFSIWLTVKLLGRTRQLCDVTLGRTVRSNTFYHLHSPEWWYDFSMFSTPLSPSNKSTANDKNEKKMLILTSGTCYVTFPTRHFTHFAVYPQSSLKIQSR